MFWKGEGCAQFPLKSETHSRQAALPSYRRCKQPMENRSPFLWTLSKELFLSPYASLCMFTPCSPCQAAIFDNRTSMAAWEASNTFPGWWLGHHLLLTSWVLPPPLDRRNPEAKLLWGLHRSWFSKLLIYNSSNCQSLATGVHYREQNWKDLSPLNILWICSLSHSLSPLSEVLHPLPLLQACCFPPSLSFRSTLCCPSVDHKSLVNVMFLSMARLKSQLQKWRQYI